MRPVDVNKLVDSLLDDMRKRDRGVFGDALYRDEPILRTGKQMRERAPEFVPVGIGCRHKPFHAFTTKGPVSMFFRKWSLLC